MLLWINKDNHIQQISRDAQMDHAIVRNDLVLYLDSEREEDLSLIGIMGCDMNGADFLQVCDRKSGQVLFKEDLVVK